MSEKRQKIKCHNREKSALWSNITFSMNFFFLLLLPNAKGHTISLDCYFVSGKLKKQTHTKIIMKDLTHLIVCNRRFCFYDDFCLFRISAQFLLKDIHLFRSVGRFFFHVIYG